MLELKLGKKPATPSVKDIMLRTVLADSITIKDAPPGYGHWPKVAKLGLSWGMLGNNRYGDCAFAGAAHETMLLNAENGVKVTFTDTGVLSDYASTGFDPATGANDNGTDIGNLMEYRRKTGVIDAAGNRHKIGAYVALEPKNWDQLLQALYVFNFVAVGFEVPSYAMDQFSAGREWTYRGQGTIEGGHYVPCVGRPGLSRVKFVTWGALQDMSRAFYEAFSDEAYGVVSVEELSVGGRSPEGLDYDALNAALQQL